MGKHQNSTVDNLSFDANISSTEFKNKKTGASHAQDLGVTPKYTTEGTKTDTDAITSPAIERGWRRMASLMPPIEHYIKVLQNNDPKPILDKN